MVSVNITLNQLVDVIKSMDEIERIQLKSALEDDLFVTDETRDELFRRKQAFLEGNITSHSWDEMKSRYE